MGLLLAALLAVTLPVSRGALAATVTGELALQGPVVAARALTGPITATPGSPVALLARLGNIGSVPLELVPFVEMPPGWELIVPAPSIELASRAWRTTLLAVRPGPSVPAGSYEVAVTWRDEVRGASASVRFRLAVPAVGKLDVAVLESPAYVVAENYGMRFVVRNAGNRPERVRVQVSDNLGFKARVHPNALQLEPGASAVVTISVEVPSALSRTVYHRVVLTATSEGDPGVRAAAGASVEVVARAAPLREAYRWFPLVASWTGHATPTGHSLGWRLAGSGRVGPTRSGTLAVDVSTEGARLTYRLDGLTVTAGQQPFSLSPLTRFGERGDGIEVRVQDDPWEAVLQAVAGPDGLGLGGRVAYALDGARDVSLQVATRPETGDAVMSAAARFTPWQRLYLQAEVGCTGRLMAGCLSRALRADATLGLAPWSLSARWEGRDPGYAGRAAGGHQGEATVAVDVSPSWRLSGIVRRSLSGTPGSGSAATAVEQLLRLSGRPDGTTSLGLEIGRREEAHEATELRQRVGEARLYASHHLDGGALVVEEVGYTRGEDLTAEGRSAIWGYGLSAYLPLGAASVSPYLRVEHPVEGNGDRPFRLSGGVEWRWRLPRFVSIALQAGWKGGPPVEQTASVDLRHQPPTTAALRLTLQASRTADSDWSWQLKAAYQAPLELPIGKRPDVGSLEGRVVDDAGAPVPGVVVRLGTLSAVTDRDGRFDFPAVSPGVYYLTMRTTPVEGEVLSQPATPWRVEIGPRQAVQQTFRLVRPAGVRGRVEVGPDGTARTHPGDVPASLAAPPPISIAGMVVEAIGQSGTRTVLTAADGSFSLERLLPGVYRLRLRPEGLPPLYVTEPAEVTVTLSAGERRDVVFTLRPVVRRIEVYEGGELLPEAPAP